MTTQHMPDAQQGPHKTADLSPPTPITFRLPSKNGRDPWFHLSRSWYFAAEARGDLKMIRLRAKGKTRGVTLLPFEEVRALIMNSE